MPFHLECLLGSHRGRRLPVTGAKPAVIKTQKADEDAGEVRIALVDGRLVLDNRSRMKCLVNGKAQSRATLAQGDEVTIGKQAFRVVAEGADGVDTEDLAPPAAAGANLCSVCDGPFERRDRQRGWSGDGRRICHACLSKGVKPDHLPHANAAPPAAGGARGARHTETEPIAPVPPPKPAPAREGEGDKQRRQRRLSASQLAQVDPAPPVSRNGLMRAVSKVGQVFGGRDERRRLEVLEGERQALLAEAGRQSLTDNNGFGLPDHCLAPLLKGLAVTLRLQDLSIAALEEWRTQRQRLTFLDAEIAALRASLRLGPDPTTGKRPSQPLRAEHVARQDRAFQAMDSLATQDIGGQSAAEGLAVDVDAPAEVLPERHADTSGRRKALRRKR